MGYPDLCMEFKGKALYNLLRHNWKENPQMAVKDWQVENYRLASTEELFARLQTLTISLTPESFLLHAENCESPEELLEYLWVQESLPESQDKVYLLLFELWRRLVSEKRSLSIFCDDLDDLISRYEDNPEGTDEEIQSILHEFEGILDETVDLGGDAKVIFAAVEENSAHNIESFLYDYTLYQLENSNGLCASEILDGFYPYVEDTKWFDFLRARLFALTSPEEANLMTAGLLEQLEADPDFNFLFEITSYLARAGDHPLFAAAVHQCSHVLENEEDLRDLLEVVSDYYRFLDRDDKVQEIDKILERQNLHFPEDRKLFSQFL